MHIFEDIDKELSSEKYKDWFCLLSKCDNCITALFTKQRWNSHTLSVTFLSHTKPLPSVATGPQMSLTYSTSLQRYLFLILSHWQAYFYLFSLTNISGKISQKLLTAPCYNTFTIVSWETMVLRVASHSRFLRKFF